MIPESTAKTVLNGQVEGGRSGARPPLRHYWLAAVLALAGLIVTAMAGWQMDQWARARDAERFESEARLVVQMLEQKMERYESGLVRLRDACAWENGEVSYANWSGSIGRTVNLTDNFPNVRSLVVAPRISRDQRAAFEERAPAQVTGHPGRILTSRTEAEDWFPVWRRFVREGFNNPPLGDDLLAETPLHPSFETALSRTTGWVAGNPRRFTQEPSNAPAGFWFAVPLRSLEFTNSIPWKRPYETVEQAEKRRSQQRANEATGLLAAFIGSEMFLEEFNHASAMVWLQLFADSRPTPEALLNPGHLPPPKPRQAKEEVLACYGRRWIAHLTSTPRLEAASLRYRAWLVWGVGAWLSLGAAAAVAWQTRGRWREAALATQLREALARQERLSRDLHDGTLQTVYGIGLALQRAQRLLEKRPAEVAGQLAETTRAVQRVIGEMRAFIRAADPVAVEEVSLGAALAGVVTHLKLGTEMELQLDVAPGADRGLAPEQSLQLLNIAREALSNSIRHSRARKVRITLAQADGVLRLEVADDGCGFEPEAVRSGRHGLGNLAARVRDLGGVHRWETAPGQGTRFVAETPLTNTATHSAS